MKHYLIILFPVVALALLCHTSCTHKTQDKIIPDSSNFPAPVAKIMINKCAIAGCHNAASYQNAGQLQLDTWEHLFNGSASGASVVPYSPDYSSFLYYVNTDSSLGTVAAPVMPVSTSSMPLSPLSKDEYMILRNWIAAGAPDKNGNVAFASNPETRQKIYLAFSSGCNQVGVIDAKTRQLMRYIPVGNGGTDQAAHEVTMASDGQYAYVPFFVGGYLQKLNTLKDTVAATLDLGTAVPGSNGSWSVINLSPDNNKLMVTGFLPFGYVAAVNTTTMQTIPDMSFSGISDFINPHGIAGNATYDTFYTALQYGNTINKFWFAGGHPHVRQVAISNRPLTATSQPGITPDPHQILMSPDYSRYFVTCQNTNEVRIMDAHADTLIKVIPVGVFPQEMTISRSKNFLFVVCMQDANPTPGCLGSVYVIDLATLTTVHVLSGDFNQPHGITVDEQDGLLYIASTNKDGSAHHSTTCGVPGWFTVYDLNTFLPDAKRYEVLSFPYSLARRF